jgi:hypothetical protein
VTGQEPEVASLLSGLAATARLVPANLEEAFVVIVSGGTPRAGTRAGTTA